VLYDLVCFRIASARTPQVVRQAERRISGISRSTLSRLSHHSGSTFGTSRPTGTLKNSDDIRQFANPRLFKNMADGMNDVSNFHDVFICGCAPLMSLRHILFNMSIAQFDRTFPAWVVKPDLSSWTVKAPVRSTGAAAARSVRANPHSICLFPSTCCGRPAVEAFVCSSLYAELSSFHVPS